MIIGRVRVGLHTGVGARTNTFEKGGGAGGGATQKREEGLDLEHGRENRSIAIRQ